jgi:Domain of unknown function (DUF5103)
MKYRFLVLFTGLSFSAVAQKDLVLSDKVYEPQIKTVQLYPDHGNPTDYLYPAVAPIGEPGLVVEFDDLQSNRNNYYAKLIHCSYDWTKSNLMDLDFLPDYNEFPINDYSFSSNTHLPYLHYRFPIPQVKLPGNYVLIVYRENKSDLILSKRFMISSEGVSLLQNNQLAGAGTLRSANQQLNFVIDYGRVQVMNPLENIHVVIRQNQRWDNAKVDVKPTFLRDADTQLEYNFFDADKFFAGGNEFRFVDFRSLMYPGQNTGTIKRTVKPYQLFVQQDLPRTDQAYAQYNDSNGNYQVDNQDSGEPKTNSNYLNVTFSLALPKTNDPIYVSGAFNGWNREDENKMVYVPERNDYEATVLLKQGLYNYQYIIESKKLNENYLEGNHFETENMYEILVYNHTFERNIDVLVGYYPIAMNPR